MIDKQTDRAVAPELFDGAPLVCEEVLDGLLTLVEEEGSDLLGPDGLMSQVPKAVLECALDEELTDHLVMRRVTRWQGFG